MRIPKFASFLVVLLAAVVGAQAQTEKIVLSYPTGVSGLATDSETGRTFVLLPNYYDVSLNAVQVLDASGNVLKTYPVPVASAIVYSSEYEKLYVGGVVQSATSPTGLQAEVVVLSPGSGTIRATIPITTNTGLGIVAMASDNENGKVFVSDASDSVIAIIRGTTLSSIVPVNGVLSTGGLGVNADSGKVFAAITAPDGSQQVAIVSHKTGTVTVSYIPVATSDPTITLGALDVDSKINREYTIDDGFPGTLTTLNSKGTTLATTTVGNFPLGLDSDSLTGMVFVANAADGSISKVSEGSDSVISTTTLSTADAQLVEVDARRSQVWVAGSTSVTLLSEN